jgi:hypothetical protein
MPAVQAKPDVFEGAGIAIAGSQLRPWEKNRLVSCGSESCSNQAVIVGNSLRVMLFLSSHTGCYG